MHRVREVESEMVVGCERSSSDRDGFLGSHDRCGVFDKG